MTRSELIDILCTKYSQFSFKMADEGTKRLFQKMSESLMKGKRIEVRGFGSFSLRFRRARLARNPKTGEQLKTQDKYSVHFKPGKELRERVDAAGQAGVPIKEES